MSGVTQLESDTQPETLWVRLIHDSILVRVLISQGSLLLRRHPQAWEEHPRAVGRLTATLHPLCCHLPLSQRDLRWILPLFVLNT